MQCTKQVKQRVTPKGDEKASYYIPNWSGELRKGNRISIKAMGTASVVDGSWLSRLGKLLSREDDKLKIKCGLLRSARFQLSVPLLCANESRAPLSTAGYLDASEDTLSHAAHAFYALLGTFIDRFLVLIPLIRHTNIPRPESHHRQTQSGPANPTPETQIEVPGH